MAFTKQLVKQSGGKSVSNDGRIIATYSESYLCHNDTFLSIPGVIAAFGVNANDPYAADTNATCRSVKPDRLFHHDPYFDWNVDVEWSSDVPTAAENPLARPVKRRVFTNETQRNIFKDNTGKLIVDAAGSPFDGGIPVNHHMPTVVWERNETSTGFDMGVFSTFSGKLNSVSYAGCDPGTLLLVATADETFEGNYHFWRCMYQMIYNDQGWQPNPVNAGLYQLVSGVRTPIYEDGQRATEPVPLTLAGAVVPVGSRPASCTFITVAYNGTMSMASLGLSLT